MAIFEIFVLSSAIALASAGVSQYYINPYSHSLPVVHHSSVPLPLLHPQPFSSPLLQNQLLNIPQFYHASSPLVSHSLNSFVQQPVTLAQPLVNVEHSLTRSNAGRNLDISGPNTAEGIEYGFGYRTQYDDGASSMVVFVMGPESQKAQIARSKNVASRKLASNLQDRSANNQENSEDVSNVLSNTNFGFNINNLLEVYPIFKELEQPKTSVFHLYSNPANVFQLSSSIIPPSSTPSTTTSSTTESVNNDDPESVAIESAEIGRYLSSENESVNTESVTEENNPQSNRVSSENFEETSESSSTERSSESSSQSSTSTTTEESTEKENVTTEATTAQ